MHLLFGFSGRIGRLQWWLAQLAMLVPLGLGGLALLGFSSNAEPAESLSSGMIGVIAAVVVLVSWINVAATVKRFHDRNKSGFWFLIVFVPYVGAIWQIVECGFFAGTPGTNDYGSPNGSGRSLSLDDLDIEGVALAARDRTRMGAVAPASASAAPARPPLGRRPAASFGRRTAV